MKQGSAAVPAKTSSQQTIDLPLKKPLERLAERLTDPADRAAFARVLSWADALPPEDEVAKIAELLGFVTLIGRQLPEALGEERQQLRQLLASFFTAFREKLDDETKYHAEIKERLARLPEELAQGVRPADIAKAMSESFRQQIQAAGLQDARTALAAATTDLKSVTRALDEAVKPLSDRYGSIASTLENRAIQVERQSNHLLDTADKLKTKNELLLHEVNSLNRYVYAGISLVIFAVGVWTGIGWEHRRVSDAIADLRNDFAALQQTIKTTQQPPPPAPAGKKKSHSESK